MPRITPTRRPGFTAAAERQLARLRGGLHMLVTRPGWPALLALAAGLIGAGVHLGTGTGAY